MTNPVIGQSAPTPLYDLFEKFPDIPRSFIIKHDVVNWGIKFTPLLNWIGRWTIPHGGLGGYSSLNNEISLASRSDQVSGLSDIPLYMMLRDGTNIFVLIKKDAPYEIRYEGDGSYMLYWNEMAVEEVKFTPRPKWLSKTLKDGTPLGYVFAPMGDTHT